VESFRRNIYQTSLALLTDLYQLTMAYGYWKAGMAEHQAVFNLYFRKHPFQGGFSIACGLEQAIEYIQKFKFDESDLSFLARLCPADSKPLFEPAFAAFLRELKPRCDVDAMPEGTAVFPHEPLLRVTGPLAFCQILETPLLNIINFQTLIATKAARICLAADGDPVLEFGLRRAQGPDGGISASRAAFAGGCAGTSNLLAGKLFGLPVRGTHAHSWVMAFDTEEEAFQKYAEAMPDNSIFLVDTYKTIEGVRNAIRAGAWLRSKGHRLAGIRLDSGDLGALSIQTRRMLDDAGFPEALIVASGDLDEYGIRKLKLEGAKIDAWGVGTRLVTAFDEPSMGCVYKLAALRKPGAPWKPKLKISDGSEKSSIPGILQVRRYRTGGQYCGDVIFNEMDPPGRKIDAVGLKKPEARVSFDERDVFENLLSPVMRDGSIIAELPELVQIKDRTQRQLECLKPEVKQFTGAEVYPVGLEQRLHELRALLMEVGKSKVESRSQRSIVES
jgi:nicotinate phosphoribosyltransferase